jgi:hypothetical protein
LVLGQIFFRRRVGRRIAQPPEQAVDLQRQRRDRRAQLVRGDGEKFVARPDSLAQVFEQQRLSLLRVAQILVQHQQAGQDLLRAGVALGGDAGVGDRAAPRSDLGDVLEHPLGEARLSGGHGDRPPPPRPSTCEN